MKTTSHQSTHTLYNKGVKLICTGGHLSLAFAFKGTNVISGLYKCNYTLTVKRELGAATREKQGGGPDSPAGLVFATCALQHPFKISHSLNAATGETTCGNMVEVRGGIVFKYQRLRPRPIENPRFIISRTLSMFQLSPIEWFLKYCFTSFR